MITAMNRIYVVPEYAVVGGEVCFGRGRRLEKPWASYMVMLIEPTNAGTVWTARATSRSRFFANWEDLRNSITDKTIEQLLEDGVISR